MPESVYPDALDPEASLPSDLKDETDNGDGTPRVGTEGFTAGVLNRLGSAVRNIEAALGTDPAGPAASVRERAEALEASVAVLPYSGIPRLVHSVIPIWPTTASVTVANRGHINRCRMPFSGTLRDISVWVAVASGNIRAAIYDTGQTTPGTRTMVYDSGSLACPVATAGWKIVADPQLDVIQGEFLDLAFMADNGTAAFGRIAAGSNPATGWGPLPAGFMDAGGVSPRMFGHHAAGSFAFPATLSNAQVGDTSINAVVFMIARIE